MLRKLKKCKENCERNGTIYLDLRSGEESLSSSFKGREHSRVSLGGDGVPYFFFTGDFCRLRLRDLRFVLLLVMKAESKIKCQVSDHLTNCTYKENW